MTSRDRNSKRKLDDYAADSAGNVFTCNQFEDSESRVSTSNDQRLSSEADGLGLQFFVRLITGKSILVRVSGSYTVGKLMEEVSRRSGIPVLDQRVVYKGKTLMDECLLNDCGVVNDCVMHMFPRLRSSNCSDMWPVVERIIILFRRLCDKERDGIDFVLLKNWIRIKLDCETDDLRKIVVMLVDSNFPAELMKVYLSADLENRRFASECIKQIFDTSLKKGRPDLLPLVLEFGNLLRGFGYGLRLYRDCQKVLSQLVCEHSNSMVVMICLHDILPFIKQSVDKISSDLNVQSMDLDSTLDNIRNFGRFFEFLIHVVKEHSGSQGCIPKPIPNSDTAHDQSLDVTVFVYNVYKDLLAKIHFDLRVIKPDGIPSEQIQRKAQQRYLPILKVLYNISKLYLGAEEKYRTIIGSRKTALSYLILSCSSSNDDPFWALELKYLLDFKAKRHLALLMFPNVKYCYDETSKMLIDRSNVLSESFEYMKHAGRYTLLSHLFVEFKNEEATGPGVLREWLIIVCQAIFYTGNPHFTACPNDRRRFYLNPASTVEPLCPDYLRFCGRVIALALRHRVQIGILFDRIFFLQLAGMPITLEDVKMADPIFYKSCKQILDMDAEFVDTDALGLTFVREVEEMGSRKVLELCRGGKNKVVNSHNRGKYVELLIVSRFVVSTSWQWRYFSKGFEDILADSLECKCFFKCLDLEDLDLMLQGSATDISVEDWKAHTVYNGYNESDEEIAWFWMIVDEMSVEQQRMLLFFWTSIKYLPPEGFQGLNNSLQLSKVLVSQDRLPTSRTCFHTLCLPPYSSYNLMRARLNVITQEHVGLSFGSY